MTKLKRILSGKQGSSILLVLVLLFVFLYIGTSVLVSASNTMSTQQMRQEIGVAREASKGLLARITAMITDPARSEWKTLPQGVYDGSTAFSNVDIDVSGASGWIGDPDAITADMELQNPLSVIITDAQAEIPAILDEDNNVLVEAIPAVPEVAQVTGTLVVHLEVTYGHTEYVTSARYNLIATLIDGTVDTAIYTLIGYTLG